MERERFKGRFIARMTRMSRARNRLIEAGQSPDYPTVLPTLRRQVIVRDFDFTNRELVVDLFRCPRVDCYTVVFGGEVINQRAGWSTVLEIIRGRFARLRS